MRAVQFRELENVKEFQKEGKGMVWCAFTVDEFMGFTSFRVRATEGLNGEADFRFTEEYELGSGNSREKECIEEKYVSRMKNALEKLLETV